MPIYLYVKTHQKTGLKYLGITSKEDVHKYSGSGKYWKSHLNKHGYYYDTLILKVCQTTEEVKGWGIYYSELWDIVEALNSNGNKVWANLKPETGEGAPAGKYHHMKNPDIHSRAVLTRKERGNYNRNQKAIDKGLQTKVERFGTLNMSTLEGIEKGKATKQRNGTTGNNLSRDAISRGIETRRKNGKHFNSPAAIAKCLNTKQQNGTGAKSPEVIRKALETRKKNGTLNTSTPESIAARVATRKLSILAGTDGVVLKVCCPHCNKVGGQSIMKRWHFDNCTHRRLTNTD